MSTALLAPLTTDAVAALPKVDLLPPEVAEERRFVRARVGLAAVVVASVGAVGALYAAEAGRVDSARADLEAVQAQTATLSARKAQHADVPVVFAAVDATKAKLEQALGQEVRWSYQLNDLSLAMPTSVWIEQLSVAQSAAAAPDGAAAAPAAPAAPAGAAPAPAAGGAPSAAAYTLTFTGKAERVEDIATWLEALAERPGWTNPSFTSAQVAVEDGRKTTTFSSTVEVGGAALSGRFAAQSPQAGQ